MLGVFFVLMRSCFMVIGMVTQFEQRHMKERSTAWDFQKLK